jgi:hypothetical protein
VTEPATREEYERRYVANNRIEGFGFDTVTVAPCPFCAAPDWQRWPVANALEAMREEATCSECGRSARTVVEEHDGIVSAYTVQTGGPDPAEWVPIRREQP